VVFLGPEVVLGIVAALKAWIILHGGWLALAAGLAFLAVVSPRNSQSTSSSESEKTERAYCVARKPAVMNFYFLP
jgi:hypothetical protein